MRKKFIPVALLAALLLTGCNDYQTQIDELNEKVETLEQTQQQALLDEIARLQGLIESMAAEIQSDNDELADKYAALLANLSSIEEEIANNEAAVYYGNVLTDEDFAALSAQGATIITGKVVATSQAHIDALANVKMVGADLKIKGGDQVDISSIENVAGDLIITGFESDGATVSMSSLASVGGSFILKENTGLSSVTADNLGLVFETLHLEDNSGLTTLSMDNLDVVNELYIYAYDAANINGNGKSQLVDLNLSDTDVMTDAMVQYLGEGANLSLGAIGQDLMVSNNGIDTLSLLSEEIGGNFQVDWNGSLKTILADKLAKIGGNLTISSNVSGGGFGPPTGGLIDMPSFEALTSIGGNVDITGNSAMKTMDAFNNVTEIKGNNINLSSNGNEMTLMNVFNSLVDTYNEVNNANISVSQNTEWFTGFASLEKANDVYLNLSVTFDANFNNGEISKLEGFDNLTEVNKMTMYIVEVTEFSAFSSLDNFKYKWGEYLNLSMPKDATVTMCAMSPILTKIKNGDFDTSSSRKATFRFNYSEMDRDLAIDQLLNGCE